MFDPSKLDLDLHENLENKNKQKPSESDKITESKKPSTQEDKVHSEGKESQMAKVPTTESKEGSDFLGDLLEANANTPETKSSEKQIEPKEIIQEEEKTQKSDTSTQEDSQAESTNNYGVEDDTSYDKELIQKEKNNKIEEVKETEKIIYDTNVNTVQDIFNKLVEKNYDFVTIEPFSEFIKIIYRKDKVEKETLFIKYPAYTQILIKAKALTKLKIEETQSTQEGIGEIVLKSKGYKVLSKSAPGGYGEKLFLKLEETQKKIKKEKKSISFWQILGFLGAALFTALLIGGGFLTFVLLNANTVAELTFFNNLGVDVGSIRDFTSKLVNGLFSIIILIETLFLFTFTFKAILTKKEFKKEKIARTILSIFFLILTFLSGFLWITLSQKINELKGQNYGKMLTYDNAKYLSPIFDENGSLVNIDESLIGPVTLRFDISEILNQLVDDNNYNPQQITWIFDKEEIEKPVNDLEIIYTFSTAGLHIVDLRIEVLNGLGEQEIIERTVAKINIDHVIQVNEKQVAGGGIIYQFDASNLKDLGKIEWFYIPDLKNLSDIEQTKTISKALKKPANKGYLFDSKILYDEEMILGIKILTGGEEKEELDKIFVFSSDNSNDEIKADIRSEANINNAFKYTLSAENIETILGNGNIAHFLWRIGDKSIKNEAILTDLETSSEIEYIFKSYGNFNVYLDIVDSRGNTQTIEKIITIQKRLELSREVRIQNNGADIENLTYNLKLHEYVIDEISIPTTISLDARFIKPTDANYVLRNVEWDFDSDDDIDSTDKNTTYEISYEGGHKITGIFHFEHRRKPDDKIVMKENIYIEGVKKEAQLLFDIKVSRDYVPVTVSFDASKSQVKNENIVKFTWDYGDGIIEIRDAIVPGHKYSKPGDYEIKLLVTTESGKEYSASKKLILKPKPQSIKITSSLKIAPTYQSIDFLSDKSEGQITSYFWDFGDGGTSTKANPSHEYVTSGTYEVNLRLDFANNNVLTDKINIDITEE